ATAEGLLRGAVQDLELIPRYWQDNPDAIRRFPTIQQSLKRMGLLARQEVPTKFQLPQAGGTKYEKMLIQRANAALLAQALFPGMLQVRTSTDFVDLRLATPKAWRDVYRYERGNAAGWTRYGEDNPLEFNADGLLIVAKDELGKGSRLTPLEKR